MDRPGLLNQHAATFLRLGLPKLIGMTDQDFTTRIDRLGQLLPPEVESRPTGNIPLCIAFRPRPADLAEVMSRIEVRSAKGVVDMYPLSPEAFDV